MTLSLQSEIRALPDHVSCRVDDEIVLLSLQTGEYYGLNPVAASVWQLIQEPRTIAEIRDALLEEYEGVTAEECTEQLMALLHDMAAARLIEST